MDRHPISDERILEALEACRPGSDDLADPAMADLAKRLGADPGLRAIYERLQQFDAKLALAIRDVPVPEGLQRRIIDQLAAAAAEQPAHSVPPDPQEAADASTAPVSARPAERPKRLSRRRLLVAAGVLSTGAVLLVAAMVYLGTRTRYDGHTALEATVDFFKSEAPEPGYLLSDSSHRPPEGYPIGRGVRRMPGTRWRTVGRLLGTSGVAYDLPSSRGGGRATLYVVALKVDGLRNTQPPARPTWNTGGVCGAAWQEGRLLYVLVVQGGGRQYQACLASGGLVT